MLHQKARSGQKIGGAFRTGSGEWFRNSLEICFMGSTMVLCHGIVDFQR